MPRLLVSTGLGRGEGRVEDVGTGKDQPSVHPQVSRWVGSEGGDPCRGERVSGVGRTGA